MCRHGALRIMNKRTSRSKTPEGITWMILGSATLLMLLPIIQHIAVRPQRFLKDLGFFSGPRGTPEAWAAALIVGLLTIHYCVRRIPLVAQHFLRPSPLKVMSVLTAVVAATIEEAFFRRWVMDAVLRAGGGGWVQVLASAVAFGVPHGYVGLIRRSFPIARGAVISTTIMGAALAVVYLLGERSLAPCIAAHFLITASIEPGLILAGASGQMRKAS